MERWILVYTDPHDLSLLRLIKDEASVADFVIGLGDYTSEEKGCIPFLVLEFTDIPLMGNHDTGAFRCGRIELFGIRIGLLGGVYSPRRDTIPPASLNHDDRILDLFKPKFSRGWLQSEMYLISKSSELRIIENGPVGYEGYYTTKELQKVLKHPIDLWLSHTGPNPFEQGDPRRTPYMGDRRIEEAIRIKRPKIAIHGHHHVLTWRKIGDTLTLSLDRSHVAIVKTDPLDLIVKRIQ